MAALIKNALIKQLSKYLKNVSANQINISTFKGEGEMKNIQLDENVLMDLIELPTWLRITNARCNKAGVKIQWTKLKTHPIIIVLDKIEIEMEIADPLREYTNKDKPSEKEPISAYGFIDKIIDAMQLNIDSITITIKSSKFNANLNMSNIFVYSTTPNWRTTNDIRNTRLKDLEKEEIIVYKEISWEICRLEAYNIEHNIQNQQATSIKLIMNPSKVQIALKKKLSDKSPICSTFRILLNEIYWMANDTQLKSAIGTYNTISKLMKKAFVQKRKYCFSQQQQQQSSQLNKTKSMSSPVQNPAGPKIQSQTDMSSKVFRQYDIKETSLHLHISILNIHLYADDNYSGNKLIDGGALQVLFKGVCIDHYPYHRIGFNIEHWNNYNYTFKQRENWSKSLIEEFTNKLDKILSKSNIPDLNQIRLRNSINLLEACTIFTLKDLCIYKVTTNLSTNSASATLKSKKLASEAAAAAAAAASQSAPVDPNNLLKDKQFFIEQQSYDKRPFIGSNFTEYNLPGDTIFAHFFFSEFYFPEDCNYPVPCPQIFAQISPMLINVDFLTLLWVNTLIFSLYREKLIVDQTKDSTSGNNLKPNRTSTNIQNLKDNEPVSEKPNLHCDTHLELITPKINLHIYPKKQMVNIVRDFVHRPCGIEIGFSRIVLSNVSLSNSSKLKNDKLKFQSVCERAYNLSSGLSKQQKIFKNIPKMANTDPNNNTNNDLASQISPDEPPLNHLAPCFKDLLSNQNLPYVRYDLSFAEDLTKLVNTSNEANYPKLGLFLKSLNKNALNKNANKDVWSVEFESMWLDFCDNTSSTPTNNYSLIQNTTFKVWLVNVWDFYRSSSINDIPDKQLNSSNVEHAYKRLDDVISINKRRSIKRSSSLSLPSNFKKKQQDSHNLCRQTYSKINVIGEINNLQISCDHQHFLFIMRLLDTIDMFGEQLKLDGEQTLKYETNSCSKNNKTLSSNQDEQDDEDEDNSLNIALILNKVDVELNLNDNRLVDFESKKDESFEKLSMYDSTILDSQTVNLIDLDNLSINKAAINVKDVNLFDASSLTQINDPMKEQAIRNDFEIIAKQLDREFMSGYLKYVYGLSAENPNLRHSFNFPILNEENSANHSSNDSGIDRASLVTISYSNNNSGISVNTRSYSVSSAGSVQSSTKMNILTSLKSVYHSDSQSIDNDLLDDNDNFIPGLEQDDASSLVSYSTDLQASTTITPTEIPSNNRMLQSASSSSLSKQSNTLSTNIEVRSNSISYVPLPQSVENSTQTKPKPFVLKLKMNNLQVYAQNAQSNTSAIVTLDQLEINDKKSKFNKKDENDTDKILIKYKKLPNDSDSKNGILQLVLENLVLDLEKFVLDGLIEFVDDNDFYEPNKKTLPVNILVKNSKISIIDYTSKLQIKNQSLLLNHLLVQKLPNNELVISHLKENIRNIEFMNLSNSSCLNGGKKRRFRKNSLMEEIEYDQMSRMIRTTNYKAEHDDKDGSKLASLVYMLRKSKDENRKIMLELKEKENAEIEEQNEYKALVEKLMRENEELKQKLKESQEKLICLNTENHNGEKS